jgi:hypothetical protein
MTMSKISSKWRVMPRRSATFSACGHRAVGENELAAGKLLDRGAEARVGFDRRVVDVVNILEKVVGPDAVLLHQAAERRAVAAVIVLLDAVGFFGDRFRRRPT